jgi:hypothetical protein
MTGTKLSAVLFVLLLAGGLAAAEERSDLVTLGVFVDLGSLESIVPDRMFMRAGASVEVSGVFTLDLPVTAASYRAGEGEESYTLLDIGMLLKYYPGGGAFWGGITLFQGVGFIGESVPEEEYHYMAETAFGFTLSLPSGVFFEPSLLIRDPLGTFRDSLDYIQAYVPTYGNYRLCLTAGWKPQSRRDGTR